MMPANYLTILGFVIIFITSFILLFQFSHNQHNVEKNNYYEKKWDFTLGDTTLSCEMNGLKLSIKTNYHLFYNTLKQHELPEDVQSFIENNFKRIKTCLKEKTLNAVSELDIRNICLEATMSYLPSQYEDKLININNRLFTQKYFESYFLKHIIIEYFYIKYNWSLNGKYKQSAAKSVNQCLAMLNIERTELIEFIEKEIAPNEYGLAYSRMSRNYHLI